MLLISPGLDEITEMAATNIEHFIFNMVHISSRTFFTSPRCITVMRGAHIVFSLDFIAFLGIVLTMRCLLKVRATLERVKLNFHSPIVEYFTREFLTLSHLPTLFFTLRCAHLLDDSKCTIEVWIQINAMHRGEKKHRIKQWSISFTDAKPQKKSQRLISTVGLCAWDCVCVCGHWLWSVRQAWKDYRSGNNFTVCMGNCCDLFQWTEQILNCKDHKTRKNERENWIEPKNQ